MDAHYDIMVFDPLLTVTFEGDSSLITHRNGNIERIEQDPFELLRAQAEKWMPAIAPNQLPFCGGWLGYLSYDLGRAIETLPTLAESDITLPQLAMGLYDKGIIRCQESGKVTLFGWTRQALDSLKPLLDKNVECCATDAPFMLVSQWQSNMTEQAYKEKFGRIKHYLRQGDCYQINLAQRYTADYEGNEWDAYIKLQKANQSPFAAFIKTGGGAIISVSPERLLSVDDKKVQTKPIKGTRPRSNSPERDEQARLALQNAEKDKAENLMIVDLLRNDLSKVAKPGTVVVPKLFDIESFPAVHHLVSTIECELAGSTDAYELLRAVFPGGSITGAPKVRAMEIIEELEPHRRSVYCGSIGYISACGKLDSNIAIRTLICEESKIHCWGGGGLVYDSIADEEYQETKDKIAKILPILASGD
ncbi:aminodeoxychorismate synthase component 1 [Corallincola platygyrae]